MYSGSKRRDAKAPDGVVAYGDRLVRNGGVILFAGEKFQDDRLTPFVGQYIGVEADQYWITHPRIWWPTYPQGTYLFGMGQPGETQAYQDIISDLNKQKASELNIQKMIDELKHD